MKCCICGKPIADPYGHNPQPIKQSGRCCGNCNQTVVIPARYDNAAKGLPIRGPGSVNLQFKTEKKV